MSRPNWLPSNLPMMVFFDPVISSPLLNPKNELYCPDENDPEYAPTKVLNLRFAAALLPAKVPIATLFDDPESVKSIAPDPIAVLFVGSVASLKAPSPIATLSFDVMPESIASFPIAVLESPVVLFLSALYPSVVF